MIVNENQLDEWVRQNSRDAQGVIVELIFRLVAASCPRPIDRRFPLSDSIGQHGPDGRLNVAAGFEPFIPEGQSIWEIGTGIKAGAKATDDYRDATRDTPEHIRRQTAFVFVTPLSARRDWEHTWKSEAQATWLDERRKSAEWREVHVIDGTKLIDWLGQFLSVELWLAERILGKGLSGVDTPGRHWALIRSIGEPPPLAPQVFLSNREEARQKLSAIFSDTLNQLHIQTRYPDQVVDFIAACIASLDDEIRADVSGRCLIASTPDVWRILSELRERHVLIADPSLDLSGPAGTKLIQIARRGRHAIIFSGTPGGIPDPASSVALGSPRQQEIHSALEQCGYREERARTLAQRSGGNLGSLLRCLQNLSLMPQWAEDTAAADLAIAEALGSWSDNSASDRTVVEGISGKGYGEWIARIRDVTLRANTPLSHLEGSWKFIARFEGWYALGPKLFDEQIQRLQEAAISVLSEDDPQFDLDPDKRFTAGLYEKVPTHSSQLRNGLTEYLALLGTHPQALTSCSLGKPQGLAALAVRTLLNDAGWKRWASLNDLLPLLAEGSPEEFLLAIEQALKRKDSPFDQVFGEERGGTMGRTYMNGTLWALETLAWDGAYFMRALLCLGHLATRDPGGQWTNRPARSLNLILLPWLPQTCAPFERRLAAMKMLLSEVPDVAWDLLRSLLPNAERISTATRRPAWRESIPEDWTHSAPREEYWKQIDAYTALALTEAKSKPGHLISLTRDFERLPPHAREELLTYLPSATVDPRLRASLWNELSALLTKHRKFSDAKWAMTADEVQSIAAVADALSPEKPELRYHRLFSDRESSLFSHKGDYDAQRNELEDNRRAAITEIEAAGGAGAAIEFARTVQSSWRVGISFGDVASPQADATVLPALLEESGGLMQFTGGFVASRFRRHGWPWVDQLPLRSWTPAQVGQFLAFLPFTQDTWNRAHVLLAADESPYWSKSNPNFHEAKDGVDTAINKLIEYGRATAALQCLQGLYHTGSTFNRQQALRALFAALESSQGPIEVDRYDVVELISVLQDDPTIAAAELAKLEWAYLPVLTVHDGASPKTLWRQMASDPKFFCELIRLAFKSTHEPRATVMEAPPDQQTVEKAFRLVHEWRYPPGLQTDGTIDGVALAEWLSSVKTSCADSGHLEIALTMIGHALFYAPLDRQGLWIDYSVAAILNGPDADDLRSGYRTEAYNSRGAHWVDPTGKPERQLAAKYRAQADELEAGGYARFAGSLRELSMAYESDAERIVHRGTSDG